MGRRGPVIAHCTDSEDFPSRISTLVEALARFAHDGRASYYGHPAYLANYIKWHVTRKVFRIGTVRYHWPMSAHASQAFSIASCTDSEDLPCIKL